MEHRFDRLAKSVSGAMTRREALWRVGGGVVMAVLASLGFAAAAQEEPCTKCCVVACNGLNPPPPGHDFAICIQNCRVNGGYVDVLDVDGLPVPFRACTSCEITP